MTRLRWRHLAFLAAPVLASCSFLLDFGSLQEGTGGSGGGSAMGGSAGSSGAGGSAAVGGASKGGSGGSDAGSTGEGAAAGELGAGGAACPDECFHDDPCLASGCTPSGACKTGMKQGLVLDGIDETVPASTHYRVTLASGDDAFFLSSFAENNGKKEVTFYRLSATGNAFAPVASLGGLDVGKMGDPLSAAGLVFEHGLGLLHAHVALDDRTGTSGRVWHLVMDASFQAQTPMPVSSLVDGYWAASPYNYPASLYAGGQVYAAWINADGSISLGDGTLKPPEHLAAGVQATTVSIFTSTDDQPHVLYGVYGGGVFVERPGLEPFQLAECQHAPGAYPSSSVIPTGVMGLWVGAWTKVPVADSAEGFLTTNGRAIACGPAGCGADMTACKPSDANNLVRNPASVIAHRDGDPTGVVALVQAVPFIGTEGGENQGNLKLVQQRIDYSKDPPTSEDIAPPVPLATQPAVPPAYRGPDFPAIGFIQPDRFAVAWTQPAATAGDELRVRRYRMCLPPPPPR
jgi:hypothetical protein